MKQDNFDTYGTVSRFLHWSMALCFFFLMGTAIAFNISEEYYSLMYYHKLAGVVVLALGVVRVVWAIVNRKNRPYGNVMVKLGHLALYVLMLAVPLLGVLRQYGSAKNAFVFNGIELIPAAPAKVESLVSLGNQFHGELGFALFALIVGHIVMAVVHQIKGEKIINRMAK